MKILKAFLHWDYLPFLLLMLVLVFLHFYYAVEVSAPSGDEIYYINSGTYRFEHPPLAQLLITTSISLFGNNPMGWRAFSILFSLGGVTLLYFITFKLTKSRRVAILAAFIFGSENLSFVLGTLAMLDVYMLTFMLLAIWLALKRQYAWAGAVTALAVLSKAPGLFVIPIIVTWWFVKDRNNRRGLAAFLGIAFISGMLFLPAFDLLLWHKFINPVNHISYMFTWARSMTFTSVSNEFVSPPWNWLIDFKRVGTMYFSTTENRWEYASVIINPLIWICIIPSIAGMCWFTFKKNATALFFTIWFAFCYGLWVIIALSGRVTYLYYLYPALPSVAASIAISLNYLKEKQVLTVFMTPAFLLITIAFMAALLPGNIFIRMTSGLLLYVAVQIS